MKMIDQEKSVRLAGEKTKKGKKNKTKEVTNKIGRIPADCLLKDFHGKGSDELSAKIKTGFCNSVTSGLSCG
jgi:hypothetical protein